MTRAWFSEYPRPWPQRQWVVPAAVLCYLLYPTSEKCCCMIWRTSWWFVQADATSLRQGEGEAGTPPVSTAWGRCAPTYLIQMCPLGCATPLHPDVSLMYVVHLASETEMRTIPPLNGSSCTASGPSYWFLSTLHDTIMGKQSYQLNFWSV